MSLTLEQLKDRQSRYELTNTTFTANKYGWCPNCRDTIKPGQTIAKLKRDVRTLEQGKYVEYFKSNFYAHFECPQPSTGTCAIHGQSIHEEEIDCPICGMKLEKL